MHYPSPTLQRTIKRSSFPPSTSPSTSVSLPTSSPPSSPSRTSSSPRRSSNLTIPNIEVRLSRHSYPLGGSVIGTILIRPPTLKQPKQQSLRDHLTNVTVYVAGYCRIDPRWHNVAEYSKIYGKVHPFVQLLYTTYDPELLQQQQPSQQPQQQQHPQSNGGGGEGSNIVCFWATDGLELLELTERTEGRWEGMIDIEEEEILAFTFRVDIPPDLPHSINAATCKYFYSADVLIKTTHDQQRIIKNPFIVCTNPQHQPPTQHHSNQQQKHNTVITSRVKFGSCTGMAHSNGLPCHLSATEINRPRGQMTVALQQQQRPQNNEEEQTLRVSNALGQPVCVMTVVGTTKMIPGTRLHIQWDFPETMSTGWIPCHQVSACLMGEEYAIYEDGSKTRTQSYVFDTCHEWVDPGVTHRVSKTMVLSMNAPCNLKSDVMELNIRCQVDITVKENGNYNNLRIELPCHVIHAYETFDEDIMFEQDDEENHVLPLLEMLDGNNAAALGGGSAMSTEGIQNDLKSLALQMVRSLNKQPV